MKAVQHSDMIPDFVSILEMGSERVVADLAVKTLENFPGSFRYLFDLSFGEEYPLSMRAARALQLYCEKYPDAIYPYLEEAVEKAMHTGISGVRRNYLKIFAEFIDLRKLEDPGPLLNACFNWLLDAGLPPGVRIHSMGVIYRLGLKEPVLLNELKETILLAMDEGEPSIKSCGRKMLKKIDHRPKTIDLRHLTKDLRPKT